MRKQDRERTTIEVGNRVHSRIAAMGDPAVERALQDALYYERRRLDAERSSPGVESDRAFWREVQNELYSASAEKQRELLRMVVQRHTEEIVGKFDPRVYALVTRLVPPALGLLLNAATPRELARQIPQGMNIQNNIIIQGHTASLQRLHRHGRVILVPTHFSHLDSVVAGWVLYALRLPPFAYGAGLNLFTNPMLSFFMHNLGAYKVDRKKKHELYKEVLKEYCTVSLEFGYDNLFFPGGTRARSGAVESKLKLGLLGCGISAFQNNLRARRPQSKVFIVPASLSYHLVLEAETLIEDFLQEQGKSRYIIDDDEATSPRRVYDFVKNLITLDARIYCTIGKALDPFGNEVDDDGTSRDSRGRPIDINRYVMEEGQLKIDEQRDRVFTEQVGQRVVESLHRGNVILSTNLLARTLWSMIRAANRSMEFYTLLRTGGRQTSYNQLEVQEGLARLLNDVRQLESQGKLLLDSRLRGKDAEAVLNEALTHFASYHTTPVAERKAERIFPSNMKLLYYYQNRLNGYGLDGD